MPCRLGARGWNVGVGPLSELKAAPWGLARGGKGAALDWRPTKTAIFSAFSGWYPCNTTRDDFSSHLRLSRPVATRNCTRRQQSSSTSADKTQEILCTSTEHYPGHRTAIVTVSNPSKLNILNTRLLSSLASTFRTLSQDHNLRAVVLTGASTPPSKTPAFIGGADIKEMHAIDSADNAKRFIMGVYTACEAIRKLPVPVIARIHGLTLGAGLEIAASCDLRVATAESKFGMPEVAVGIPSVVQAALLPGLIGYGRTRRLVYLAEVLSAAQAERWGLVEEVAESVPELYGVVDHWMGKLTGTGSKATRNQKTLLRSWERAAGVDEASEAGIGAFGQAFEDGGKEPKEFMGKFLGRKRY